MNDAVHDPDALKRAATDFLDLIARGDVDTAWSRHVGAGFRHHNGWFAADVAGFKQAIADNARQNPGKTLQLHRIVAEGDLVSTYAEVHHAPGDAGYAVMHLFRFERGRIVELWDMGQEIPVPAVNGNGMF